MTTLTGVPYKIYETDLESDAQLRLQSFQEKWQLLEPDAVRTFIKDVQLTFSFYRFDSDLFHHIRTTNHLERLFREFCTKSDEIGAFPELVSSPTELQASKFKGYSTAETVSEYGGVSQRWILVDSQARRKFRYQKVRQKA